MNTSQGSKTKESGPQARMISVASGKGGVGKTWFAITLAHALARQGQRILLFDGDLGLANVDIQLGLLPERDLASVLAGKYRLRQSVIPFGDGDFDIIAGRSGSGDLSSLGEDRLYSLRDDLVSLSMDYDCVVIDLGAGIDAVVRALADRCGVILVLSTDEPTSLTDAYAFMKVLRSHNSGCDMRVVVNMAESFDGGKKTHGTLARACRSFLGFKPPLAGVVKMDHKIKDAIRHQTALLTRYPDAVAARDVESIAAQLLE